MSRRRVRSEIADSTAPGPGGVLTGRLGGGLYVYETSFFCRHNSRAHDRAQAARGCASTALTTPELTASGPPAPVASARRPRIDRRGDIGPRPRQARTPSGANMPERLHFPPHHDVRVAAGLR